MDVSNLSEILIEGIFNRELDSDFDVPEEHDGMACKVFHSTRKQYFELDLKLWTGVK